MFVVKWYEITRFYFAREVGCYMYERSQRAGMFKDAGYAGTLLLLLRWSDHMIHSLDISLFSELLCG